MINYYSSIVKTCWPASSFIAVSRRIPDFKEENALCLSVDVTKPDNIKDAIQNLPIPESIPNHQKIHNQND